MRTSILLLLLTVVLARPALARRENWPQWCGPNRDSISPDKRLLKRWPEGGPRLLWKATGIGIGYSSPVVCDDTVYITGDIGDDLVITAFDMKGKEKWKVVHDKAWTAERYPGSRSTPTIDGGKLYLLSAHGLVGCYSARTGAKRWTVDLKERFKRKPPGYGYSESLLVYKDLVIVTPGGENCIVALDKSNGRTVWTSQGLNEGANFSSPIGFTYKRIPMIVTMTAKAMVCVDARTGWLLWRNERVAETTRAICATPVYYDGYVFGATGYNNGGVCIKLSVSRGKLKAEQVWDTKDIVTHHGGYVIVDGYIYGSRNNSWSCLNLKTGKLMWNEKGVGGGSICYADGMLYTFSERNGRMGLVVATPEKFILTSEFSVEGEGKSWAHPVVIGKRLYLRYDENLYVFDVKAPR